MQVYKGYIHQLSGRSSELYKKIRPGEPLAVESAESLINAMFFDPRRYDLAKVGRYKFNKKLHLNRRIVGHRLAEDVVDASTGEILAEEGTVVTKEMANTIQNSAVPYVWILGEEDRRIKVLSNLMVDIRHYLPEIEDPKSIGVTEAVYYPVLENILEENDTLEDRIAAIHRDIHDLIPKHITKKTSLLLLTTICIWNMALAMPMISTTWATVVYVR